MLSLFCNYEPGGPQVLQGAPCLSTVRQGHAATLFANAAASSHGEELLHERIIFCEKALPATAGIPWALAENPAE